MSTLPNYLLSIHGKLAPAALVEARTIHNQTAGAPANVAAAKSLGDLSHMVYVPLGSNGAAGEFLILDVWNSMEGLGQFFANPHVQEQAAQIFSQRDPVIWQPAEGFYSYHLPVPHGKNDRIVAVIRGKLHSRDPKAHNDTIAAFLGKARANSNISHDAYFLQPMGGAPETAEFFGVDVWSDAEGMGKHYQNPELAAKFQELFAGQPEVSIWMHPDGEWVEW